MTDTYVLRTDKLWNETYTDIAETMAKWGVTGWQLNYLVNDLRHGRVGPPT